MLWLIFLRLNVLYINAEERSRRWRKKSGNHLQNWTVSQSTKIQSWIVIFMLTSFLVFQPTKI